MIAMGAMTIVSCGESKNHAVENESNASSVEATQAAADPAMISVGAAEFQRRMNETPGYLLDVRTPGEFAQGHLEGANLINIQDSDFQNKVNELDKDQTVYVYCRSGGRSGSAARMMENMGFKHVVDMSGGIMSWSASGLPTVK